MANNEKVKYINIHTEESGFVSKLIRRSAEDKYNLSDIALLRKLFSDERAKILYVLKKNKPKSIYGLAKILGRNFKSVSDDIKILEKFGFVEFHDGKTGKRSSLIPKLVSEKISIVISI